MATRVRIIVAVALLVIFGAGFFVREAHLVLAVFGRYGRSPYVLGFTMFPLWSLAALVGAAAVVFSLIATRKTWIAWFVALAAIVALIVSGGLRFSVFIPEAAHRSYTFVDYLLWPGTLWVKWWALVGTGLLFVVPLLMRRWRR